MTVNINQLKHDIKDLKNTLLLYDRPPKNAEGDNGAIWIDKKNNKLYVKEKGNWKEIPLGSGVGYQIFISDDSPSPYDGKDGDIWLEY